MATTGTTSPLHDIPDVALRPEHLCDFRVVFERTEVHTTPLGTRMNFVVAGGRVEGPRFRGSFLPTGGDWLVVGSDGVARLDVRATIETDDGALVHLTSTGRADLDAAATARFLAGERIAWDEGYARSCPLFETGDDRYAWLNATVTVAVNQLSLAAVDYRVFALR